jgi:hypothetical protein
MYRNRSKGHGLDSQGEAFDQVITGPAIGPDPLTVLPGDDPEAVMLDVVAPELT